ncbi:MAG: hypothetical protein HYS24_13830 [Ignavibacteriales bacterium]|nr:hypothetical protein [Ignavibacteriales bacterium]
MKIFNAAILLLLFSIRYNAQTINIDSVITPISIGDSTNVADSLKNEKSRPKLFLKPYLNTAADLLKTFLIGKKSLDYENYRSAQNFLMYLPLTAQYDFNVLGSSNIPSLYFQKNKNLSITQNNFSFSNSWNGSNDLSLIQNENVNSLEVSPLSRGFISNSIGAAANLNIVTQDSITYKPITRIRYYQAPDDEAFIDFLFGVLITKDLYLKYRLSNASYTGNFKNSEYGVWKSDLTSIYRLSDSILVKLNYYHLKSNSELSGGINLETLENNSVSLLDGLYNSISTVNFENRSKTNKINNVTATFYGKLLPNSFSKLNIIYSGNEEKFKQYDDSAYPDSIRISNVNKYSKYFLSLNHHQEINDLEMDFTFDYQYNDYSIDYYNIYSKRKSYALSGLLNYKLFDSILIPAVYTRIGTYENQYVNGLGTDITLTAAGNLKLKSGTSIFMKPYLISELYSLPISYQNKNYISNYFITTEYTSEIIKSSLTYFSINEDNSPVPVFNNENIQSKDAKIIFPYAEKVKTAGFNIYSNLSFWKVEFLINANILTSEISNSLPKDGKYNLFSGIYYRDKLYNNNLDLKTGFNFFYNDNLSNQIFDFQIMRSSNYFMNSNKLSAFKTYSVSNTPFRIDFTLAGRIQDRATFYFAYENIFARNYFIIPYYPMASGGIKLGISWDLFD